MIERHSSAFDYEPTSSSKDAMPLRDGESVYTATNNPYRTENLASPKFDPEVSAANAANVYQRAEKPLNSAEQKAVNMEDLGGRLELFRLTQADLDLAGGE